LRLKKARITNYRSVKDSGWIDFEDRKTILVGPNEAGKTAILRALQQINPPEDVPKLDALRDYPRGDYNDITTGKVTPSTTVVVEAHLGLEDDDLAAIDAEFHLGDLIVTRHLDNSVEWQFEREATCPTVGSVRKDLVRLAAHIDGVAGTEEGHQSLTALTAKWSDGDYIFGAKATELRAWLEGQLKNIDEDTPKEEERYDRLLAATKLWDRYRAAVDIAGKRVPILVLFSNYYRVRPLIHLDHLATRIENNLLDDDEYDYGNKCLLSLLGFNARELSNLGKAQEPGADNADALVKYRDQLDKRSYQLNAASVKLTDEIKRVWNPDLTRAEANRLRVTADGQYLKVVVEDDLGVEIELDQRSEGFQWLVSFFVVFFAEAVGAYSNAILLLDEPGMSLHALKQREFRETITRLAEHNQTVYTTHSPFLVGPNELDLVRVVEMTDRRVGTKVHLTVAADDVRSLLPLQEALGYDLAQSLFAHQRNLVLEGLTDLFYIEAVSELLRASGDADLNKNIALVVANSASKIVYYATILHAHRLKVAALLDSDAAGDQAANQDTLVATLGNKSILRTKDAYTGPVTKPEVEDLLRDTLIEIGKAEGWDVSAKALAQPARPIVDLFTKEVTGFSKYKLAKAFVRWTRDNDASKLTSDERSQFGKLIATINSRLK
jgi:energy-coupling factor transporter ATP-binding protein EcfA2